MVWKWYENGIKMRRNGRNWRKNEKKGWSMSESKEKSTIFTTPPPHEKRWKTSFIVSSGYTAVCPDTTILTKSNKSILSCHLCVSLQEKQKEKKKKPCLISFCLLLDTNDFMYVTFCLFGFIYLSIHIIVWSG